MEKIITTSCPFPLIKLDVNIRYAEMQKPSGVGYIILVLVKDAKNRNERLSDIFKRFGVPEDLQFIFADEIEVLLDREILRLVTIKRSQGEQLDEQEIDHFQFADEYEIGHLQFTDKGEKMFRNGAIPTGEEKGRQKDVYFNPLTGELLFTAPPYIAIEKTDTYPKDFMERVETDFSGLNEYLVENNRELGLQKEEHMLGHDIKGQTNICTRAENNLELRINTDGMELSLKSAGAEDFYARYFSPDMLERTLAAKNKFKFNVPAKELDGFGSFKNLSKVHLPEEYEKQIAQPAKLLLRRKNEKIIVKCGSDTSEFEDTRIAESVLSSFCPDWSFIIIDKKNIRSCTAASIKLIERILDKPVSVNLLVEEIIETRETAEPLKAVFNECLNLDFSTEQANIVKAICEMLNRVKFAADYIEAKLDADKNKGDRTKQIEILIKTNGVFANISGWQETAAMHADDICNALIQEMTRENLGYTARMINALNDIRKANKDELLFIIADKFSSLDKVDLFNLLTEAGFNENEALSAANVVAVYSAKILSGETGLPKSTLSGDFEALANKLNDLKENLGIRSAAKYTFREDYAIDRFVADFKAFKSKFDGIKKYTGFAQDDFKELGKYAEIMQPVFDYIMIERNASQKPGKITGNYILQKINAGDWRAAIGDMVIRLEYILGNVLKIDKSEAAGVFEKIDRARDKKILTEAQASTLHDLRIFRNRLSHPTDAQINFNKAKIIEWANTVSAITEKSGGKK